MRSFKIYGIWPQTHRHTYIHTTSANAVTLVWGSLRLAPIIFIVIECLWHRMKMQHKNLVHWISVKRFNHNYFGYLSCIPFVWHDMSSSRSANNWCSWEASPISSGVAKPRHTRARAQATFACDLAFACRSFKLAPRAKASACDRKKEEAE